MGVQIVTFSCIFAGFGLLALLVRFIQRVNEENRQKHDKRRYFASEKGWRYISKGDRNYEISTPSGSPQEWNISISFGEDSSQTTWTAPNYSYAEYVLRLQKRMLIPLTPEQRAKAAQLVTSVIGQFIKIQGNPQRLFIEGRDYSLEHPVLRDIFSVITLEPSLVRTLCTSRVEEILIRWLYHTKMTQIERESLTVSLGPQGLQVWCSGIAEDPETIGLLVELGTRLASAYSDREYLSSNRFDNRAELDQREETVGIGGIYHS